MKTLVKIIIIFCLISCSKFDDPINLVVGEWFCTDKVIKNSNYHIDCSTWYYEFYDNGTVKVTDSDSIKFTTDYLLWNAFLDSIQIDQEKFQFSIENNVLILENILYLICLTKTKNRNYEN